MAEINMIFTDCHAHCQRVYTQVTEHDTTQLRHMFEVSHI